ncbi:MAG: hypothetical protein ACOCUJ_03545 [Thiohalospira sp.]|uniref:hypothetical protein n=1 Tax=Thiohalospira sp. TaxID=3080549 RepID=UPI003980C28E
MERDGVPQEGNETLAGERKGVYARDEEGRYVLVPSRGWSVEELVTQEAVEWFREQAEAALERARAGRSSPLEYHMYARRMDPTTLAQVTGFARWRVRRHLRPRPFRRLSPRKRQRYARALGLAPEVLSQLPGEGE